MISKNLLAEHKLPCSPALCYLLFYWQALKMQMPSTNEQMAFAHNQFLLK